MSGALSEDVTRADSAYYYPEPYWVVGSASDWVKTLLLFFDEIAILLPGYMRGVERWADPIVAGPLEDQGLLRVLEPATFLDVDTTEALTDAMVALITQGAFDDLDKPKRYQELSQSRLGWDTDIELSQMLVEELESRNLARPTEDGVSIPLHPVVRQTVLLLLAMLAPAAGRRGGLTLHPTTDRPALAQDLVDTLKLEPMPSYGHVVVSDLSLVAPSLESVPLESVLAFKGEHGAGYRAYRRTLRDFVRDLGLLPPEERKEKALDRREELADEAHRLNQLARRSMPKSLAGFAFGVVGAAWDMTKGDAPAGLATLGQALLDISEAPQAQGIYSYLFQVQRELRL